MTGPGVTVTLPAILVDPESGAELIRRACVQAIDAEVPSFLGDVVQSGAVPTNRGILRAAVAGGAVPAKVVGGNVVGEIVVAGEASQYAAVQDMGRRAGKPMSWRFLYYGPGATGADGWRTGWVNRKMRGAVERLASDLEKSGAAIARRRTKKQVRAAYERRACWLIAVSIAAKIRDEGMRGKQFISAELPKLRERVAALASANIAAEIRRAGLGG